MFIVQLFDPSHGWTALNGATSLLTRAEAIEAAKLYRMDAHTPARRNKPAVTPRPVRVVEIIVHKGWASDAPIELN